jgi:hypothetical protein
MTIVSLQGRGLPGVMTKKHRPPAIRAAYAGSTPKYTPRWECKHDDDEYCDADVLSV